MFDVFGLLHKGGGTCRWNEVVHHFYAVKVNHHAAAEMEKIQSINYLTATP